MLSKVFSFGLNTLDAYPVTIEVDAANGLPSTTIVGLPDNAIKESRERVRSAIKNSGYEYTYDRITINLSPADTKKEGPVFDLAIALGILAATNQIDSEKLKQYIILGELALDGHIQPIDGALTVALSLTNHSYEGLILPLENAEEAAMATTIKIFPFKHLSDVIYFLSNDTPTVPFTIDTHKLLSTNFSYDVDFNDVKGQAHVKRGLEIAASGGHNVLMVGPPGSGKSMLAKRFRTILPEMSFDEILETTKIHSAMGLLKEKKSLVIERPFRCPHHTTSAAAIVGGGSTPKPGEVTLSHNGILFLDELPEFHRDVLESLRQPLEDQTVTISRASGCLKFPSRFILIAAMNPCPCGFYLSRQKKCQCSPNQITRYLSRISGPLLDRIDIHLNVPALNSTELFNKTPSENSQIIKERTKKANTFQQQRFKNTPIKNNAHLNHKQIKQFCPLSDDCKKLLKAAIDELGFSARGYDKILKVSRTIADLANCENIQAEHLAEAIGYRSLDREFIK